MGGRERPRRRPSMSKITCVMVGVAMAMAVKRDLKVRIISICYLSVI